VNIKNDGKFIELLNELLVITLQRYIDKSYIDVKMKNGKLSGSSYCELQKDLERLESTAMESFERLVMYIDKNYGEKK
jgi:hypothetical protein